MATERIPFDGDTPPSVGQVERDFRNDGLQPRSWSNGPGYTYGSHQHSYHKRLVCVSGDIVFHTPDGDIPLGPGDRMELPPGTDHAATVGDAGVTCVEAPV
jgi:quercetin dioxygenase-like cupin family protein